MGWMLYVSSMKMGSGSNLKEQIIKHVHQTNGCRVMVVVASFLTLLVTKENRNLVSSQEKSFFEVCSSNFGFLS